MADTGNGATLTRSGFTVDITGLSITNQTMETLDISLLSDTSWMQKVSADLADGGSLVVDYLVDATGGSGEFPSLGGAGVATTVTFPIHTSGNTTAATFAGTTIVTDRKLPDFRNNELQTASVTLTYDGGARSGTAPTWTTES